MVRLEWAGKDKVINHHRVVPFRSLNRIYSFDENGEHKEDNGSENMIIHGDNLEALKALLPEYEGKIKCIYIDPPYNTGNEEWTYNDNMTDPFFKDWLNTVVGKEGEDFSRHDKWLCMMYPRLVLLKKLLKNDGVIVISIGYHEVFNLQVVCKEIFGNHSVHVVTVQTSGGKPSSGFTYLHEYLIFITPNDFQPKASELFGGNSRTPFEGLTLSTFDKTNRPNQAYPIYVDSQTGRITGVGKSLFERVQDGEYKGDLSDYTYNYSEAPLGSVCIWPVTAKGKDCVWRLIPSRLLSDWEKGYIKVSKNKNKKIDNQFSIQYLPEGVIKKIQDGTLPIVGHEDNAPTLILGHNETEGSEIPTIWLEKDYYTVKGTTLLNEMLGPKKFNYPKPLNLVMQVIQSLTDKGDIVLDSFGGSGTTAHAVLQQNMLDSLDRRFIVIELDSETISTTCSRVQKAINGYGETPGTGGSFSFYKLGEPYIVNDQINPNLDLDTIRGYIYYTETKQSYSFEKFNNPTMIGRSGDTAYYLLYGDNYPTDLDDSFVRYLDDLSKYHVIYADTDHMSDENKKKHNIRFMKIPRDIRGH